MKSMEDWRGWVSEHYADYILTVGSLVFAVGMITTLMDSDTVVPISSSLATGVCLAIFSVAQWFKFNAKFGAVSNLVVSAMWFLVAIFRHG